MIEKEVKLHVNKARCLLGYPGGEDQKRLSTLAVGWKLKRGKVHKYKSCAIKKARQKSIPRCSDLSNEKKAK